MVGIHSAPGFEQHIKCRSLTCGGSFGGVGQSNFICDGSTGVKRCLFSDCGPLMSVVGNVALICLVEQRAIHFRVEQHRLGTLTWRGKYFESSRKVYRQNYSVFS